jgi:L-ascorbate metabolism protein UlaG (beta-lactamase superfamily)
MIITYNTLESFKIQLGDTVIALNPVSKKSKLPAASFGADVAIVSIDHPDMNGIESVSRGGTAPFAVTGPGEYEVAGVFIRGFQSVSTYDGKERPNTIYLISLEDSQICFLGALGSATLSPEILEALPDIDILFVPVGGEGVLSPTEASKLVTSLEPRIIIPMHYDKETLAAFLKEEGSAGIHTDKLTLRKKEILEKEGEIIVLKPMTE